MFNSFSFLAMQRREDVEKMIGLGVNKDKVRCLGNLKYDTVLPEVRENGFLRRADLSIRDDAVVFIAGSTHPGEEEILCDVFSRLLGKFSNLYFVIAPRNNERGRAVQDLVEHSGLKGVRRSKKERSDHQVLVLDTMGELVGFYGIADIAFVGGSFVDAGGHNPLEPAVFAKPVLFGPHMEDFADIVDEMVSEKAAVQLVGPDELYPQIVEYLQYPEKMKQSGQAAQSFVLARQGVTKRHIDLIERMLS